MNINEQFKQRVAAEREYQKAKWDDESNTCASFAGYIVNYATRFLMPFSFDPVKYDFGTCMVKVAALAEAGYEWWVGAGRPKGFKDVAR